MTHTPESLREFARNGYAHMGRLGITGPAAAFVITELQLVHWERQAADKTARGAGFSFKPLPDVGGDQS